MSRRKKKNAINVKELNVNKSLLDAISKNDLVNVKKLVQLYGLSHCEEWHGGFALLCKALNLVHVEIAKFLLQEGAKTVCEMDHVNTPLHFASTIDSEDSRASELICLLLEKNAQIDAPNEQNATSLHIAAVEGGVEIVRVLLDNNASLTAQTNEGLTPLFLAAESGHEKIVQMMLEHACANLRTSMRKRNSALLDRILLCNPSVRDKFNELVVNAVMNSSNYFKVIDVLVGFGFVLCRKKVSRTLLLAAAEKNYSKLVESILTNGFKPDDAKFRSLLFHTAIENGCVETIKVLLNAGYDENLKDKSGKSVLRDLLDCKDASKCVEIMQLLMPSGDIKETQELFLQAVNEGSFEVCKALVDNGVDINALNAKGLTPLHLAVAEEVNKPTHTQKKRKEFDDTSKDKIVELLLNSGADVSLKTADGFTAFHQAVKNGRRGAVLVFLNFGIDVDQRAENQYTPLHLAALEGHTSIFKILCMNRANREARDKHGSTPLHLASSKEHTDIVEILCRYRVNVNACQINGATPLLLAAHRGNIKAVKILCKHKANPDVGEEKGYTALHSAAFFQVNGDLVEMLLDFGANIDARGNDGKTPLHWAVVGGSPCEAAAKALLENGCDINAESKDGKTPLCAAIADAEEIFFNAHGYSDLDGEDSDEDNFDDAFHPDRSEMIQRLKRHAMKLKVAGFYVNEKNLNHLFNSFSWMDEFKQRCKDEIRRLKRMRSNRDFTLYDVLANTEKLSHANKISLMRFLKPVKLCRFPIYRNLILSSLKKSIARVELISPAQKALDVLSVKINSNGCLVLPKEMKELIFKYLSNSDLKSLIFCVEGLKIDNNESLARGSNK